MPPMPPSAQRHVKMGMLMGGTVGGIMGFIYGTVTIFQYGAGQAGVMRTLGKYMVGSGATFSVFMGIGSIIRTDTTRQGASVWARSHYPPLVHPRRDRLPAPKQR
ncbi:reactive mitochondrial oxygen species modulator 1-domain-containing protein [Exophiala viscosa]|uniref:Reactive mitochondrial oxygen species modulator 1-domain-containing protein n=1 Tax=Exophiala viscosa TaxID=2486360 RepID=A0AAN6ICJ2_9EURO|nr:reactive mitochondrial oxygen species modulator 1-domain-containing protein [Exophiala viscosa]KAI1628562.1 reactive mitochondrial oxygen species modulator 1-domain-containing protein [Exophiala viscosa]